MNNFVELLADAVHASKLSDEAFTRLQDLLVGDVLPSYAVAMSALGHSKSYFCLPQAPFNDSTEEDVGDGMDPFPVMVDTDHSTIGNAHFDLITGKYYPADDYYQHSFQDADFNHEALCSLSIALIDSLDEAIREASDKTKNANEIIALFE
jgi:hypothetical protein